MKIPFPLLGTLAFSFFALAGCSSKGTTSSPLTTGDGGTNPNPANPGLETSSCDNVVAVPPEASFSFGNDVRSMIHDGKDLYLLMETGADRVVARLAGDHLEDLGKAPSDTTADLSATGLAVDADAFFFDAIQNGKKSLFRVPRNGGAPVAIADFAEKAILMTPSFVADEKFLYFRGSGGNSELARVGKAAGGTSESLGADLFYPYSYQSVTLSGEYVYTFQGYMNDGEYTLSRAKKTPGTADIPNDVQSIRYKLGNCVSGPGPLSVVGTTFYAACAEDSGNVSKLFRLPDAPWGKDDAAVPAVEILSGADIGYETTLVVGGNAYVTNPTEGGLMRAPIGGGAATRVLKGYGIRHVLAQDKSLWIASDCGVQRIAL